MIDDLDGIPRGGHEPDPVAALAKLISGLRDEIRILQRAAPQRSMSLTDGGDLTLKNGGRVAIEDQGEVAVVGEGQDFFTREPTTVLSCLANRTASNPWIGYDYIQPGLYFSTNESRGATDARVTSSDGIGLKLESAVELLRNSPQAGPNIMSKGNARFSPDGASIGAGAWDDVINPGGGNGLNGLKGSSFSYFTPRSMSIAVDNYDLTNPAIPPGYAVSIEGTLEEGILRLYGRNGVDITGPFTVDGSPISGGGGPVSSVAGRTGDVVLAKGDVGLSNVDNTSDLGKPISTVTQTALNTKAPTSHTHTTAQVTGLDTALAGKASTAVATSTTDGLMPSTDKSKIDGSTPSPTAFRLLQRDGAGRAQVADPAVAADIATKGYVDAPKARTSHYVATGSKANFATGDQAISSPAYQSGKSTANLGTPAAGQLTITEAGIYTVTFAIGWFTTSAMTAIKPVTGRSFVDISDSSGDPYSRTAVPVGEDVGTGSHAGLLVAAGDVLKFNIIQTSGGVAYYRARIWLTKLA